MNLFIDLKGAVMRISPQRTSRIIFKTSVILLALLLTGSLSAHAATIAVTTTTDELTAPGTGCSLREAIQNINNAALTYPECLDGAGTGFGVSDTINVPAGTYTTTLPGVEDLNAGGDFDITKPLTITGAGQATTIIQGGTVGLPAPNASDRVFHASATAGAITFDGVTIQNGVSFGGAGGGIYTLGATTLTMTNSTVSGNFALGTGGGISAASTVTLTNSTVSGNVTWDNVGGINTTGAVTLTNSDVSDNRADYGGTGGIYSPGGLTMTNSAVSGNWVRDNFGGIYCGSLMMTNSTVDNNIAWGGAIGGIYATGNTTMTNSTISNNKAQGGSVGGIQADGNVTLTNSTIYGNSATSSFGGLYVRLNKSLTMNNSIIANNTGGDCSAPGGTFISNGYNIDSDGSCGLLGIGDQPNTTVAALNLAALANNGVSTMTHALLGGSLAIDAGTCVNATDQRGVARPQGVTCDIGAYEAKLFLLTVTVSGAGMVNGGTSVNCPATLCSEEHASGTVVTLIASASSGETFTGWGGACAASGTATTCTFTKTSVAQTVSASFGGLGCTDPAANNYNPNATVDDGSCTYGSSGGGGGGSSGNGNQPPTAGRHGDKWLHYPDNGDSIGPDTKFVWDELIDPDGDTVLYDLYICINGDFADCTPIPVTPSYRTAAAVGFGMTGALFIGFCFVGGVRSFRGRALLIAALLVAGLTLSHCGNSSDSNGSTTDGGRFSCDGEDGYSVCYDSKGLAAGDYQWRVTASDGKGATNTSETRSFTVM